MPTPRLEDHPDYHEDYVYEFNTKTRLLEGSPITILSHGLS